MNMEPMGLPAVSAQVAGRLLEVRKYMSENLESARTAVTLTERRLDEARARDREADDALREFDAFLERNGISVSDEGGEQ